MNVLLSHMWECASVSLEQLMAHVEKTEVLNMSSELSDYICADEPDATVTTLIKCVLCLHDNNPLAKLLILL